MSRGLPKRLLNAVQHHADRVDEAWKEQDEANGPRTWSNWIWLKPGWRNSVLDPVCPLHAIHESSVGEAIRQLRGATPCDCDDCQRELNG